MWGGGGGSGFQGVETAYTKAQRLERTARILGKGQRGPGRDLGESCVETPDRDGLGSGRAKPHGSLDFI